MANEASWTLVTSDYCVRETEHNLPKLKGNARHTWFATLRPCLRTPTASYVLDRPLSYRVIKDRPVVISALSVEAEFLLTLDRDDFQELLGRQVYGLPIRTPGDFLKEIAEWP